MTHEIPYLTAVALVILGVAAMAVRRRVLFRVAVRNIGRRKVQVVLAVAGLLVATSILSGSFVIGDSLNHAIRVSVFRGLDEIDETVTLGNAEGSRPFFNASVYDDLASARGNLSHVDGLAPRILVGASVLDPNAGLFEARAFAIGFDAATDPGVFVRSDGTSTKGEELTAGEVFVSAVMAKEIEASVGDSVRVFVGGLPSTFSVLDVLRAEGKGAWMEAPTVFMALPSAQALLGVPGAINEIVVSNVGGVEDGVAVTAEAVAEIDAALGPGHPYTITEVKREMLADADASADNLTQLFTLAGTFTVIAGLMLIVSIFTMLAEERKPEMGIQRAIGMRRGHLTQLFTLEGFLYALASAALGTVAGLLVAALILYALDQILGGQGLGVELRWETASLLLAFALGFLLTIATIALTSGRISKLNIVRAVRNIPEPSLRRTTRGQLAVGILMFAVGLSTAVLGFLWQNAVLFSPGVALAALGIAQMAYRKVGPRIAFSAAAAFTVAWFILPIQWFPGVRPEIGLFIVTGVMLVTGGVLLVVLNNDVFLAVLPRLAAGRRRMQPVVRTAVAYPMNRPFRTGITIAIFALVIFTIVVVASIQALIGASVGAITRDASGGYDIFGITNPATPIPDPAALVAGTNLSDRIAYFDGLLFAPTQVTPVGSGDPLFYEAYGVDSAFVERNEFTFYARAERFATDREVWREVLARSDVTVVDRNVRPVDFGPPAGDLSLNVGDFVSLKTPSGMDHRVEVIGILNSLAVRGFFLQGDLVRTEFGAVSPSFFLFKVSPGFDADEVAKEIERVFLAFQMQTIVVATVVEENLEVTFAFFDIFEGYLAMGLLVGIAGLGILTLRNVTERRQEMGVLRAMGYRRGMILGSLLLETSYVSALGIGLGIVLGVLISYRIFVDFLVAAEVFVIPWTRIVLIAALAYGMSILATATPAIRAARYPPAQAIRYTE